MNYSFVKEFKMCIVCYKSLKESSEPKDLTEKKFTMIPISECVYHYNFIMTVNKL